MPTTLSPEVKKKLLLAYKKFHTTINQISKEYRAEVKRILLAIDERKALQLKKKIKTLKG